MKPMLKRRLAAATKREKADLVVKNGTIIDVFTLTTYQADVAVTDGIIIGIGHYEGKKEIDAKGAYISPTFIDGHVHIESAMVPPEEFAKIVVPRGVTTIMADPHEIANVGGIKAVQYMIEASKDLPLDIQIMVPSCVPATNFEHNGAELTAEDIATLFDENGAYGLAEVMDYPAVFAGDDRMLEKLGAAWERGKLIDGHAAGLDEVGLNAYGVAGIKNDHEAVTAEEALDRLRRGMYVLMREGTAAKDIEALLPILTPQNARRCVFSTDDKHLDDLVSEGSIDASVRKAIKLGVDPLQAIQMASLNAAECFELKEKGAIAPGYEASFLFIRDLEQLEVEEVYVKGQAVAKNGEMIISVREPVAPPDFLLESVLVKPFEEHIFDLKMESTKAHVIGVKPGTIVTDHLIEEVKVENGLFVPSIENNQLKLVVAERHKALGHVGIGIVKGIPLKNGAIVATVAHDSHNIVTCGTDDVSIRFAMEHVIKQNGGIAVVQGNNVLADLSLPLAGLMSLAPFEEVNRSLHDLERALKEIGFEGDWNPFLTLSFLALPVIPSLKLTDTGLFDVEAFAHINVVQK
ncbi:adenine deaminase [Halalkalibacter nanhaiisediminis]|uniref:Adenine deaminase n=1 Tax=Halalkalibacter nanhaiisediminis TaxID=688079 RepID=A0A562QH07_9BACI|nr:adenine deaminase [Halalkalibacter nanhaiisediminis]TWI56021.1 adenine deaminase [Halalkalibacter nanhaiisediminis]